MALLLLRWTVLCLRARSYFSVRDSFELSTTFEVSIWMAHTLTISQPVTFLDIILACVCNLKHTGTCNVVVLRLGSLEDLLDLCWIRNAIT